MVSAQAAPTGAEWEILCWNRESPDFPIELLDLAQKPAELFAIGRQSALAQPRVAIVGTRDCTGYGERATRTLTRAFVRAGVTVISGMARGIDAAAHRAA